jgi:hypothetical protein
LPPIVYRLNNNGQIKDDYRLDFIKQKNGVESRNGVLPGLNLFSEEISIACNI